MPVYLTCPHCDHPVVVPPKKRSACHVCRQCGNGYVVSDNEPRAIAVPARSFSQLRAWFRTWRGLTAAA